MLQAKIFLKKWIRENAKYQNSSLRTSEVQNLADDMIGKLDIHHTSTYTVFREGTRRINNEFLVRIGKPQFRGTVNYTLPSHSLLFNTRRPTDVRIVTSGDYEIPMIDKIIASQLLHWEGREYTPYQYTKFQNLLKDTAVHPHVSAEGQPCLGGWSNAWSSAISSGQIPSLVNVAKSFLNTWTSNDAYWNINSDYRYWRMMPEVFRKATPFVSYLTCKTYWYEISNRNYARTGNDYARIPRHTKFRDWMINHIDEVVAFAALYDFDDTWGLRLMNLFNGYGLNSFVARDTESNTFEDYKKFYSFTEGLFYGTIGKISRTLGCPDVISSQLASEALISKPKAYVTKPWTRTSSQMGVPNMLLIRLMEDSRSKAIAETSGPRTCEFANLMEYHRVLNNGKTPMFNTCIPEDVALKSIAYYLGRHNVDLHNSYESLRTLSRVIGGDVEFLKNEDSYQVASGLVAFARGFYNSMGDELPVHTERYTDHFANIGIEYYSKIVNEYSSKRLLNARDKYKSIVRNINFGDDSEQNQLSAF
jgi:hypothetical protein